MNKLNGKVAVVTGPPSERFEEIRDLVNRLMTQEPKFVGAHREGRVSFFRSFAHRTPRMHGT